MGTVKTINGVASASVKTILNVAIASCKTWNGETIATSGYLPETDAYLASDAALSALSTPIKDGIDRWFRDLMGEANGSYTTYNVWSRLIAIYPMAGATSSSVAVNAKSPGTYNLTHTGSPTINAGSWIVYNGSSQYSDTGFTPSNSNTTSDMVCYGFHRRDSNNDVDATIGIASTGNSYAVIRNDTFRQFYVATTRTDLSTGSLAVNALWHGSYSSSTVANSYRNGSLLKTNTSVTVQNCGNKSFFIGACQDASLPPIYGGANTVDYVWLANGTWTDAEQTFMYDAFNALQTVLSR